MRVLHSSQGSHHNEGEQEFALEVQVDLREAAGQDGGADVVLAANPVIFRYFNSNIQYS